MLKVKVYNIKAEEAGSLSLREDVFAVPYNEAVIHEVIVAQNANARQGTKSALTRSEVRGHAKKPWKQKHTGHARQGSSKGPQWRGGGVVFAPKPRDFSKKVNKQTKVLAFLSALSGKLAAKELIVVDKFELNEIKTKQVVDFKNAFKFERSVTLVLAQPDETVVKSAANIPGFKVTHANILNTKDIVECNRLVITKEAIKLIEEACKSDESL